MQQNWPDNKTMAEGSVLESELRVGVAVGSS